MSGIPIHMSTDDSLVAMNRLSGFFKWASPPSSPTMIADLYGGAAGFLRVYCSDFSGTITVEAFYAGVGRSLNLTPTIDMTHNQWYWFSVLLGTGPVPYAGIVDNHNAWALAGQLTTITGATDGEQRTSAGVSGVSATTDWQLGWGVNLSAAIDDWPDTPGNELTCLMLEDLTVTGSGGRALRPMPTSEPTVAAWISALYLVHEPVGDQAIIHDSTSNHYDMDAGPRGCTVVRDSPFV